MSQRTLGLKSGIGLVIANMVGAGVFLSTGFMAQSLTPGQILLAWVIGGVLALCGAKAYAEVARLVPEGGGEYRYLSSLMHPALGYLAGWASLLVGFSAPTALDAIAAGAFARAVVPALEPRLVGAVLIIVLTFVHASTSPGRPKTKPGGSSPRRTAPSRQSGECSRTRARPCASSSISTVAAPHGCHPSCACSEA